MSKESIEKLAQDIINQMNQEKLAKTLIGDDEFFQVCSDIPEGWEAKLSDFLSKGYDINTQRLHSYHFDEKLTPLAWAVYCGRLDVARFLIKHGADINIKFDIRILAYLEDKHNFPLVGNIVHIAKMNGNKEMINYLSGLLKQKEKQDE